MKYVVIDFETASNHATPCSLGLCVVEDWHIVEQKYFLINPGAAFSFSNVQIHGIKRHDVINSPTFGELWSEIFRYFDNSCVVAHNADFDISVLKKTLGRYYIDVPDLSYYCTYKISKKFFTSENYKLPTICARFDIVLEEHHNALSDALACANLFIKLYETFGEKVLNCCENCNPKKREKKRFALDIKKEEFKFVELNYTEIESADELRYKNIVVTGELDGISRDDLKNWLIELDCKVTSAPSSRTDFLIVGMSDLNVVKDCVSGKSGKILKSEKLILQGCKIKFIKGENIERVFKEYGAIKF